MSPFRAPLAPFAALTLSLFVTTATAAPIDFSIFGVHPWWSAPSGFTFLEVPAGARAAALGGAYVSLAGGAEAAFWNPAGLAEVKGTQIMGSHTESIQSLKHEQFAVAGELFGGGLAASLRAMYTQPIDERDELGNLTGTFGSHDLEFQLGYGWAASENLSLGLAAEVLRERIANESATGVSVSGGGQWRPTGSKSVRLGLAIQHLGPDAHYLVDGQKGWPVPLPEAVQTGISWTRELSRGLAFTGALDARATRGRQAVLATGGELSSDTGVALRMGLRQGDDLASFGAGLGYRHGTFSVDYAWTPSRLDLGDSHRFSFVTQF